MRLLLIMGRSVADSLLPRLKEDGVFVEVVPVALPLVAVLLATHVRPVLAQGRLVTLGALIEYGVSALFGLVTMLAGFIGRVSSASDLGGGDGVRVGFEDLLARLAWLGVLGVAGFVVLRVYLGAYVTPKPRPPCLPSSPPFAAFTTNASQGDNISSACAMDSCFAWFTTSVGTPIQPRNVNRTFTALLKRAGLPHIRVHDMRHTAASLMLFGRRGTPET